MRSTKGSSQHSSRSFPPESLPRATSDGASAPIETTGEFFSDGTCIALIAGTGQLRLLLSHGGTCTAAPRLKYKGRVYVPPHLDRSIVQAVTLPTKCVPYGSTEDLFHGIRQLLVDHGFSEEAASTATYFLFSSWFPDCLPATSCLLVTGPRAEAHFLFQFLACLVRHPLPLVDISAVGLRSLPMQLCPTLLIEDARISARDLRVLIASTNANAYLPRKGGVVNLYGAKAIYAGEVLDDEISKDVVFYLNLAPSHGKFPILDASNQKSIASHFQPKFLSYRLRNFAKVRASNFDLPQLDSGFRILARILGASVVDAPDLQAGVGSVLQSRQDNIRAERWVDLRCVVIEAALALCHHKNVDRVYVGELARNAAMILKVRGQTRDAGAEKGGNNPEDDSRPRPKSGCQGVRGAAYRRCAPQNTQTRAGLRCGRCIGRRNPVPALCRTCRRWRYSWPGWLNVTPGGTILTVICVWLIRSRVCMYIVHVRYKKEESLWP